MIDGQGLIHTTYFIRPYYLAPLHARPTHTSPIDLLTVIIILSVGRAGDHQEGRNLLEPILLAPIGRHDVNIFITTIMKPSEKGKSNSKLVAKGAVAKVAKYNGVTLPTDTTQRRRMRNKLSAQVHRKRKLDALNTAKQEAEECEVVINKLKGQLKDVSPPLLNYFCMFSPWSTRVAHWRRLVQLAPADEGQDHVTSVHNGRHST